MNLSQTGQTRVQGYLYVLERSLRGALPRDVADDAAREVSGHIAERIAETEPVPDERQALERLLAEVGSPLRVARAYSAELTLDEAVTTGRLVPVMRGLLHAATTTAAGFCCVLGLLVGYAVGIGLLLVAFLKPIFPDNVGLITVNGIPHALGAQFPLPPGAVVQGGYWIVPIALVLGFAALVVTHRMAQRLLGWLRGRMRRGWPSDRV
ncbi:MAG: hypothetical protein KGN76_11780 [Acidobacteriota bacterium]|nr:hypothetical protein [Acidobacteriota bacterium]